MNVRPVIGVMVPLLTGLGAAAWVPLEIWTDMKEGLIAFLGFLAASLVQVMPITANFLQSDQLSPDEAERLTASLTRQQRYWMGLLSATIVAMVTVIVSAALVTRANVIFLHNMPVSLGLDTVLVFLTVSTLVFVLIKMLGLFEGMMSLHNLRAELVINTAKRNAAEKAAVYMHEARPAQPIVPENYGQIVQPH